VRLLGHRHQISANLHMIDIGRHHLGMRIFNTKERYGAVAIALHWFMALGLVALIAMGLYMVGLADVGFDKVKITLILYHKELGLVALLAATIRLAWRTGNDLPALVGTLPYWQKVTARLVHLTFYGLMFALPMSGLLMSSAAAIPVSAFGLFDLPDLVAPSEDLFRRLIQVHRWLGYGLLVLIGVHAGAALTHHFVKRDDTLKKMASPRSAP
jgi:cytochrome b561